MRMMNAFKDLSLAQKIAVFAVLVTLLFFVLLASFVAPNITSAISNYGREQALGEARIVQTQFAQLEKDILQATTFLSFAPGLPEALEQGDIEAIRATLLSQGEALIVDLVRVVRPDGEELLNLQESGTRLEMAELESLARFGAEGSATAVISATVRDDQPAAFLVGATPITDATGEIIGVILVGQLIDSVFMDALVIGREETHVGFLYNDRLVAVTSGDATDMTRISEASDLIAQAQAGQTQIRVSLGLILENTPDIEAYAPIEVAGNRIGVFVLRIEYSALFSLQSQVIQSIRFSILTVIFIISNVLVVSIQRGIIRPFVILTRQIERITGGDYTERVSVTSKDEIGRMGVSFNRMIDVVQQREADLRALNQTLEQRVADRTQDLREARDEAVAAKRLAEENSRLKSEFLSTMSHELRTPLNAIEGFSSIMLSGMDVELSPVAEGMMKRISSNSKRLLHLINDFLDLSRIESGRLELVKEPINIRPLMMRLRDSVGILAEEKKIAFKIVIEDDVPQQVVSDEDALTKIIINLLSNAFKFTRKGEVELRVKTQNGRLHIQVSDTGIGIPVHARDYIFEEFRQVDSSSKREFGGTGLGLALVSKLTRLLNGVVLLESEVGKGSTFTIDIPLVQEKMLA